MSKLKEKIRLKVGGICMGKLIKYISILLIVVLVLSACGKSSNKDEGVKMLLKQKRQNIKVVR